MLPSTDALCKLHEPMVAQASFWPIFVVLQVSAGPGTADAFLNSNGRRAFTKAGDHRIDVELVIGHEG